MTIGSSTSENLRLRVLVAYSRLPSFHLAFPIPILNPKTISKCRPRNCGILELLEFAVTLSNPRGASIHVYVTSMLDQDWRSHQSQYCWSRTLDGGGPPITSIPSSRLASLPHMCSSNSSSTSHALFVHITKKPVAIPKHMMAPEPGIEKMWYLCKTVSARFARRRPRRMKRRRPAAA